MVEIYTHVEDTGEGFVAINGEIEKYPSVAEATSGINRKYRERWIRAGAHLIALGTVGLTANATTHLFPDLNNNTERALVFVPQITLGIYMMRDLFKDLREVEIMEVIKDKLTELTEAK